VIPNHYHSCLFTFFDECSHLHSSAGTWSFRFTVVTSASRSNSALSCWEAHMGRRTGAEMRFAWSVGESLENNRTFWDSLRKIFNSPALTGDGQSRREEENGVVYHRPRTSNNRFSLISFYCPFPFLCRPISLEMFDVSAVWQNAVQTDLFSGTPNGNLQVVL
jgi:hypothetical protein